MASLQIRCAVLGPVQTNVYLLTNEETGQTILADPADRAELLLQFLKENDLRAEAMLLTHGHFDHIGAVSALREAFAAEGLQVPLYAPAAEQALLKDPLLNGSCYDEGISLEADEWTKDGQKLTLAGFQITVIHTPGHTAGSSCYYLPEQKALLCGDTLFAGSVGRSDLPTGDGEELLRSVREKLFVLPDDVSIFPGHGQGSTIGEEKAYNPFFR